MDNGKIHDLLAQQSFPPFTIDVTRSAFGPTSWDNGVLHHIRAVNSYHPEQEETDLYMSTSLPKFVETEEDFHDFCLSTLVWFAEHETREWFRVNGKVWRDPHDLWHPQVYNPHDAFQRVVQMRRPQMAHMQKS